MIVNRNFRTGTLQLHQKKIIQHLGAVDGRRHQTPRCIAKILYHKERLEGNELSLPIATSPRQGKGRKNTSAAALSCNLMSCSNCRHFLFHRYHFCCTAAKKNTLDVAAEPSIIAPPTSCHTMHQATSKSQRSRTPRRQSRSGNNHRGNEELRWLP